jgi:hypothetical protein
VHDTEGSFSHLLPHLVPGNSESCTGEKGGSGVSSKGSRVVVDTVNDELIYREGFADTGKSVFTERTYLPTGSWALGKLSVCGSRQQNLVPVRRRHKCRRAHDRGS